METRLAPLQLRVLELLSGLGWSLSGGGALAGYHLGHRETRDLDLFFPALDALDRVPDEVEGRLRRAGLRVERIQTTPMFCRLLLHEGGESLPIDLVAEPGVRIEPPVEVAPGIYVDTAHEILVNKLTALLGRWAQRDLVDVAALVAAGCDLERALLDAPRKDAGFSPETLAWVLETLPAGAVAPGLEGFRVDLVRRLLMR